MAPTYKIKGKGPNPNRMPSIHVTVSNRHRELLDEWSRDLGGGRAELLRRWIDAEEKRRRAETTQPSSSTQQ